MKKLLLSLVVAQMCSTMSFAQSTLVATLTHGDEITMFYGTGALYHAHNAAVSGDIINLSSGTFQSYENTKGITIRGKGVDDAAPTYINGDFIINVSSDDVNRFSMEGIYCNNITLKGSFNNPYFVKCLLGTINHIGTIKNALFANCRITENYSIYTEQYNPWDVGSGSVQFINSYVSGFHNWNTNAFSSASFVNCVIGAKYAGNILNSQILNSIICDSEPDNDMTLPSSTIATNCVAINRGRLFESQSANTGNMIASFEELFKGFTGTYSDSQTFELTNEAKTRFLGTDGTEVGMFGGVLPYTSTPSYPHITKMNVANKATADGKLSVEIEVSAAE